MKFGNFHLLVLSFLVKKVIGVTVPCYYKHSEWYDSDYDCDLKNIIYTDENDSFEIIGNDHIITYEDINVTWVIATDSIFDFVPMEIFYKFTNLEQLAMERVQLQYLRDFANCNRLLGVNFNKNKLKSVGKVFDSCQNLKFIEMEQNEIVSIDSEAFRGLKFLEKVSLFDNRIEDVPEDIFKENANLGYVSFGSNLIHYFPDSILRNSFHRLFILFLTDNFFGSHHDFSDHFNGMSELNYLWMSKIEIQELHENAFEGLVSLVYLALHQNQISYLHPNIFVSLAKLETLTLIDNRIKFLDNRIFRNLQNIKMIYLGFNLIEDIPVGTFVGLETVEHISIDLNNFSYLKMDAFGLLPALKTIHFSLSKLEKLSSLFFRNFPQLVELHVDNTLCIDKSFNNFKETDLIFFQICFLKVISCVYGDSNQGYACEIVNVKLTSDQDASLSIDGHNPIKDVQYVFATNSEMEFIPQIIFNEFEKLLKLELISVGLKTLTHLENCTNLMHLNLDNNLLESLPGNMLKSCINLHEIQINDNGIRSIDENAFAGIKLLKSLRIKNSRLKVPLKMEKPNGKLFNDENMFLKINTFQDQTDSLTELHLTFHTENFNLNNYLNILTNLETLKLENNKLAEISSEAFKSLRKLLELNLRGNQLTTIHEEAFHSQSVLTILDLSNNNLMSLPASLFTNTLRLLSLNLDNNKFNEFPYVAEPLLNLIDFSFNNNELQSLQAQLDLPKIRDLSITNNKIESVNPMFFKLMKNLSKLSMMNNVCIRRDFESFDNFQFDVEPHFKGCHDNFIKETFCVFVNSNIGYACNLIMDQSTNSNLNILERSHIDDKTDKDVKHVFLKSTPILIDFNMILERFYNLEKVELWKTLMTSLRPLINCSEMLIFDLRFNKMKKLLNEVFKQCRNLKQLILTKNEINEISVKAFEGLNELILLDLGFNELENLLENIFDNMKKLEKLNLHHNKLKTINWNMKKISVLNLSFNELTVINFDELSCQDFIKEFYLNGNEIIEVFSDSTKAFKRLEYLNLEDNALIVLELNSVTLPSLQYLDISGNRIVSIHFDIKDFKFLNDFRSDENP